MAATMGTLDLMAMEQQNLHQSIGWLYVEVEKLNEKFTKQVIDELYVEVEVEKLNEKFDTLEEDIAKLKEDIDKLKEDIANLKEDICKIWTQFAGTGSTLEEKDARIASLEKDIFNLKKEGYMTDARLQRLEDAEIQRIWKAGGGEVMGTYTLSGESGAGQASAAVDSELLCMSPGCEFLKHPDGEELGKFPNHCCLDCKCQNNYMNPAKDVAFHGPCCLKVKLT